jgi:hypothetical protein
VVQGGVVRDGNALIVGQGTFGSGGERIVRLEGARATTIADGFSSLGGFDLFGTTALYVVDNCFGSDFGCGNPSTGDTVYAIPDPIGRSTAAPAADTAVVPSGTFATPQDVRVLPGPLVLVTDAVGVGAGRIAKITGTTVTNLVTGLDFLGSIADDGSTLYVANVDGTFAGSVLRYGLLGTPQMPLATGLSGAYGVARDGAGNVLVTGGFTGDFSSSTLLAVDGLGVATERAHGFGFSSDVFFDAPRGTALVLDFGVSEVAGICADADGDGVCDADCTDPAPAAKAKLKIGKQATPVGDDTLTFSGQMTIPLLPALDLVAHGARVLADDADGRVVVDVVIPGGAYDQTTKTGWKANDAGTSWTYKNPAGVVGITKVKVKASAKVSGLVSFQVTGADGAYDAGGVTLPLHAVFALGASGQCALATFPGPVPTCAFNSKGTTLACK